MAERGNTAVNSISADINRVMRSALLLQQSAPHLVVLVQTEFQDAGLLIDLINKGQVYRCLPKPMRASLLEISVNRAFQHHAKLKASPELVKRFSL